MTSDSGELPRWMAHIPSHNQAQLELWRIGLVENFDMARVFYGIPIEFARRLERLTISQVREYAERMGYTPISYFKDTAAAGAIMSAVEEGAPISESTVAVLAHSISSPR